MSWIVHKFGGSSLFGIDNFKTVGSLIQNLTQNSEHNLLVVLSAIGGVTDHLLSLAKLARNNLDYKEELERLQNQHLEIVNRLFEDENTKEQMIKDLKGDFNEIQFILQTLYLSKTKNEAIQQLITGYGELWSSKIMNKLLQEFQNNCRWVDARDVIVVDKHQGDPQIQWEVAARNLKEQLTHTESDLIITPGFVATTVDGGRTTLGRNGSDLTASIYSVLLDAEELHIWTDVDGIYSADPRRVEEVRILPEISYQEALEMAYFGAKVLHPRAVFPAIDHNIPIIVRNTFNSDLPGTRVTQQSKLKPGVLVKGFATVESIALVTIEGAGMIGVPGIAEKVFSALRKKEISVIMISQGSSEYSISIAVDQENGITAKNAIADAFSYEIHEGYVRNVNLETNCAILSVVGDNMVNQPGIASILFNALSRSRINVRMISQGSSERNISVIINQEDITRGLNAAHSAFYLSHLTLSVGIIGTGLIGNSLLNQIKQEFENLRNQLNIDIRINGLANSKQMLLTRDINLNTWKLDFDHQAIPLDMTKFTQFIDTDAIPHSVIIDCTASDIVANYYENWLEQGIHIITPNKRANSGGLLLYQKLKRFIQKGPSTNPLDRTTHYFYETTVGAGLPVVSTLRDLIRTGDRIISIQGVLSGTLSYIFNSLSTDDSFAEIVREAKEKGYTEPDPREDLSGNDVARKLIILAREIGLKVEFEEVAVESLIPVGLKGLDSINDFLNRLPEYDYIIATMLDEAIKQDMVLRYVGKIDSDGKCTVGLRKFPSDHPFANLRGSENIISFTTERYKDYPLTIQGPGAGAEVTSAGIFSELLRLAELLGSS